MSNRLEFSPADLARVRVEPSLGPFAETVLAYSQLAVANGQQVPGGRLSSRATARDMAMASFLWLDRSTGLDLFSLVGRSLEFATGRDMLLDAVPDRIAYEAEVWVQTQRRARRRGLHVDLTILESSSFAGLRAGTVSSRKALTAELADFHRRSVQPQWSAARNHLAAAQDLLEDRLLSGGVEGLLTSLGDRVQWDGQALNLLDTSIFCSSTIQLRGRGLRIIPSHLALEPQAYQPQDPDAAVILIVPTNVAAVGGRSRAERSAGGQLLGQTRTAVLAAIARQPSSTSELGAALRITVSGASQHAAVLRRAGLITTNRDGGSVVHRVTPLGERLLRNLMS